NGNRPSTMDCGRGSDVSAARPLSRRRPRARIRGRPNYPGDPAMNRIALAVSLLIGFVRASAAEPLVVDLWPGRAPGDVGIKGEEISRIHQSPLVGPTKLITNVTRPTLTVYRPAPDRNTGTA